MVNWDELTSVRGTRALLGLGQQELAALLGVSLRTIQSCEQGWRKPSAALEKSILLLRMAHAHGANMGDIACWRELECPEDFHRKCLVYRCRQGHLCWMLSGNVCQGRAVRSWSQKKTVCGECRFFAKLMGQGEQSWIAGVAKKPSGGAQ